jgi:hypothetical protein
MVRPESQTLPQSSAVDSLFDTLKNRTDSLMDYLEKAAHLFPHDTGNRWLFEQ